MVRVVIVPGNGTGDVLSYCWYSWLAKRLRSNPAISEVLIHNMPEPLRALRSLWVPYMRTELRCGADTIVVGHSSGAVAAMRLAETDRLLAVFLVSAYTSDLGDHLEAESGYFDGPWRWKDMKANVRYPWVQFASESDPFLPVEQQREVGAQLEATVHWCKDGGHFQGDDLPLLCKEINKLVKDVQTEQAEQAGKSPKRNSGVKRLSDVR